MPDEHGMPDEHRRLGFAATRGTPSAANGSFTLTIHLNSSSTTAATAAIAPREYILSLYLVDFAGDGCACLQADKIACCGQPGVTAQCSHVAVGGRIQRVAVRRALQATRHLTSLLQKENTGSDADQLLAPEQTVEHFEGGVYLRFRVSGSVSVEVSQLCPERGAAMLNALMFDEVSYS